MSGERGLIHRIQHVDVDSDIDILPADPLPELLDDALGPLLINVPGRDDLEDAQGIVLQIPQLRAERGPDARVDRGVVGDEAFLVGDVEEGPVVNGRVLCHAPVERMGVPGVDVGVEVDHAHDSPVVDCRAEGCECDGVVTA